MVLGEIEVQLVDAMTSERVEGRRWAEKLLAEVIDRGGATGPDRDTWGVLPHQVAASERAMRAVPGE